MRQLCSEVSINAYPTLKLYKQSSKLNDGLLVEGFGAQNIIAIVSDYLSNDELNVNNFFYLI